MNTLLRFLVRISNRMPGRMMLHGLLWSLAVGAPLMLLAGEIGKSFATPEAAASSLRAAVKAQDADALKAIFGPALVEIKNPDRLQASNEFAAFAAALDEEHHLVRESDTRYVLEIGQNHWPFPIPIVKREGGWLFDTAAGTEELLNRRIGKNELAVIEVMRAYVNAQREYASRDRDGDEVLEYAQKLASSPGMKDGLFWPPDLDGEISPLGPLVAQAQNIGYNLQSNVSSEALQSFHGYYYKILTGQGKDAPGGKYEYVINGNMIGGFALVAWPAEYGVSGIMTFIVNQQGRIYQRDLGARETPAAGKMKRYDLDEHWQVCPD